MDIFTKIAERRLEEAMREGAFENLSGAGKPLTFEDEAFVPEDLRLAYRVLKNAGFTPPEIELKKEILNLKELISTIDDDRERLRKLRELDFKIARLGMMLNRPLHQEEYENRLYEKVLEKKIER
ncbi:MAG: DUF1992 domain-containing protein [Nitrospiraceae bacterium]|nr:DUF1992 domain-containing protein [Nitrospiraceae bacterium]